jgi:DNA-binding IclR family transcriptional regulator
MTEEIGIAAGKIWDYLKTVEKASPTKIAAETGLGKNDVQRALGWLAREDKLALEQEGRSEYFSLIAE